MKKDHLLSKGIITFLLAGLLLSGCTSKEADTQIPDTPTDESTETSAASDASTTETVTDSVEASVSSPADQMIGEWVYAYSLYHSESDDGEVYDSCTMCTDEYAPDSFINIQKNGSKLIADYKYSCYEENIRYYGNELVVRNGAAYDGCENQEWYVEFSDPFGDLDENTFRFTCLDDGRLIKVETYEEHEVEYGYSSINTAVFLPKNSPLWEDKDNLRYFDTVTVSNAADLINSVQNNRKIILESGTYNLSRVSENSITNRSYRNDYASYFNSVSNLCIEAAEGADVLVCVSDAYSPVLSFREGSNLTFNNLTVGHDVEPGYCSGSVLSFESIDGLNINNCHLYGCGTYGIEARYTYDINVKDTEIYECTYGLVDLDQVGYATFTDCVMRDSSDLSMIEVNGSYEVTFENCEFKNNNAKGFETCYFVEAGEYDRIVFRNCKFTGNEFYTFSNREVTLENCTADNNHSGFGDQAVETETLSKEALLKLYDDAVTKQEELDKKFSSDSLADQLTLNNAAYEEYDLWDSLLNKIWAYLGETLSEDDMAALTEEQKAWIKEKEASVKEAGANFEGGSMQPMIEYGEGAKITRERVKLFADTYLK